MTLSSVPHLTDFRLLHCRETLRLGFQAGGLEGMKASLHLWTCPSHHTWLGSPGPAALPLDQAGHVVHTQVFAPHPH